MLSCAREQDQLNEFLDGTLDGGHAIELSDHLEGCNDCRTEFAALKATQALLRAAPVPSGREYQTRTLRAFRESIAEAPKRRFVFRGVTLASAAIAAAVVLVFSVYRMPSIDLPLPTQGHGASSGSGHGLPSAGELDEMTSLHALQSCAFAPGDAGLQQDTLADATSRLTNGSN